MDGKEKLEKRAEYEKFTRDYQGDKFTRELDDDPRQRLRDLRRGRGGRKLRR